MGIKINQVMKEQGDNMKITIILEGEELREVTGRLVDRICQRWSDDGHQHVPQQGTSFDTNVEDDDFLGNFIKEMDLRRRGRPE